MATYIIQAQSTGHASLSIDIGYGGLVDAAHAFGETIGLDVTADKVHHDTKGNAYLPFRIGTGRPFVVYAAPMVWGAANLPADCQAEIDSIHVPED